MDKLRRILAVYEPGKAEQPALVRAVALAAKNRASIQLVAVVYEHVYDVKTLLSTEQRNSIQNYVVEGCRKTLEEASVAIRESGVEVTCQVLWHPRSFEAICKAAKYGDAELVVKSTHRHSRLKQIFFTPDDWNVLRYCRAPVLLVKDKDWLERGAILVAIDSSNEDPAHRTLNQNLLRHGAALSAMTGQPLHVVNAYPYLLLDVPSEYSAINYAQFETEIKALHQQQTAAMIHQYSIDPANQHVHEGLPEEVIAAVADEIDAHLLLIGTVGRRGMTAAVIGNTAEHTVDRVHCDVMAFKPKDYVEFVSDK